MARRLKIVSRCDEQWAKMSPVSNKVRNCASCERDVHDLRGLTESEVKGFLRGFSELPCVRFNGDANGKIIYAKRLSAPGNLVATAAVMLAACGSQSQPESQSVAGQTPTCGGEHPPDNAQTSTMPHQPATQTAAVAQPNNAVPEATPGPTEPEVFMGEPEYEE